MNDALADANSSSRTTTSSTTGVAWDNMRLAHRANGVAEAHTRHRHKKQAKKQQTMKIHALTHTVAERRAVEETGEKELVQSKQAHETLLEKGLTRKGSYPWLDSKKKSAAKRYPSSFARDMADIFPKADNIVS